MPRPATSQESILGAARRALELHGWRAFTAERVAGEAGLSRVTLHRRGLTREVLLGLLANRATTAYRDAMWPVLMGAGSAAERLEDALEVLCDQAEQNMQLLLALDAEANATVFHQGREEALTRSSFTEPLERLLRDGVAEGSVAADDLPEAATVLFNLVGWTYLHLRSGHGWSRDRARHATLEIALRGILAQP